MKKKPKIMGWKKIYTRPIFMLKKHSCPECSSLLGKIKVDKIVNSNSPEAEDFDFSFSGGEGYMFGNIKFVWTEFKCPSCGAQFKIEELRKIERERKKRRQ